MTNTIKKGADSVFPSKEFMVFPDISQRLYIAALIMQSLTIKKSFNTNLSQMAREAFEIADALLEQEDKT